MQGDDIFRFLPADLGSPTQGQVQARREGQVIEFLLVRLFLVLRLPWNTLLRLYHTLLLFFLEARFRLIVEVAAVSCIINCEATQKLPLSPSRFWPSPTSSLPISLLPKDDAAIELEHCKYHVVTLVAVACVNTEERLSSSLTWVHHLCVIGPPDSGELHTSNSAELHCPERDKADNGDGELGVKFRVMIDNPGAKNRCMPSLMPSSMAH